MSKNKKHWEHYWETGVLTSLPQDFKSNYDNEIYDFWYRQVLSFRENSTVVDVCTGNGAIALMIQDISNKLNKNISVIGVDAANINPVNIVKEQPDYKDLVNSVKFFGGVRIEEMDTVITSKVDYVVSQYGIEYCKTKKIAPKINKILKDNGKLIFVSHSPNSDIYIYMKQEKKDFKKLKKLKLFDLFYKFVENKEKPLNFKFKLEETLNEIERIFGNKLNSFVFEWVQTIQRLINMPKHTLLANKKQINEFISIHMYARKRADDLISVINKITKKPKWYKKFTENGLILTKTGQLLYKNNHVVGTYFEYIKKSTNNDD